MRRGVRIASPGDYLLLVLKDHVSDAEHVRELADANTIQRIYRHKCLPVLCKAKAHSLLLLPKQGGCQLFVLALFLAVRVRLRLDSLC